jgi:hypothetical protein
MTIKSKETLQAIVQNIAGGMLCYTDAARAAGASPATFWRWMKSSATGDAEFVIDFMDEKVQFADAVKNARKLAILDIAGKFESRMMNGHEERVFFQGRPQYKERPECIGLPDDVVRLLGYDHRWQVDESGVPIPLTIHHEPPIAGVIKVLESHFLMYRPRSEVNVNQRVSGGVTVVDRKAKPLPAPVVQIAPPSQTAVEPIEDPADDADDDVDLSADEDDDLDLSDILGEEPSADVAPVELASEPEPDSEPEPQPDPPARAGLSELERDLLDKLRAGPKSPRPTALVNTGNSSSRADDPPERIGA